jgi:hypothetical protein
LATIRLGFNRRQMEHGRRGAAEKEAAAMRALDPQVRTDARRLVNEWNEASAARATPVLAHDWRRCRRATLVFVSPLPQLLYHAIGRPARTRSSP